MDGGNGDAAEGGHSPVGARAPAAGCGGQVAGDSTGRGAEGGRGPVGARAPAEGNADANCGAAVVGAAAGVPATSQANPHTKTGVFILNRGGFSGLLC